MIREKLSFQQQINPSKTLERSLDLNLQQAVDLCCSAEITQGNSVNEIY